MSCASCHQPDKGFSDGRYTSLGAQINGEHQALPRATPSVWNVAFLKRFMWDGRSDSLHEQALLPLLSDVEMGNTKTQILRDLRNSQVYNDLFMQAFSEAPSIENLIQALAAFQSSLVSFNSRYDRYAHGDQHALNQQEIEGYNTFRGFVARCSQCHIPPLFSDSELAVVGAPASADGYADPGAGALSEDPFLMGAMRVPTLRNITKTAPYFHSGQFETLPDVVSFYNNTRGHMAPPSQDLKIHWHVHMTDGPKLSDEDIRNISAFLTTLEDETNLPQVPDVLPSGLKAITTLEDKQQ
ncbi:MAG: cytochrome c peroxidase, partial [Pseudomonadota bacterium]|nr:cytochrome c peroxidase [Pseudomonadota bacterium]